MGELSIQDIKHGVTESVDSNTTIKNTAEDVSNESSDEEDLEMDEWLHFFNIKLEEAVKNPSKLLERSFIQTILDPLQSMKLSSEVVIQIVNMLSLPFSSNHKSQDSCEYINILIELSVPAKLLTKLQFLLEDEENDDVDCIQSILSLLLHLSLTEPKVALAIAENLDCSKMFEKLVNLDNETVLSDSLALLLVLTPVVKNSDVLLNDQQLMTIINDQTDQNIAEKALLCLLQMKTTHKNSITDIKLSEAIYEQKYLPLLQNLDR